MSTAALPGLHVRRASAAERRRLCGCLLIVAGAHLALLMASVQPSALPQTGVSPARSVQLRFVPPAAAAPRVQGGDPSGAATEVLARRDRHPQVLDSAASADTSLQRATAPATQQDIPDEASAQPGLIAVGTDPYGEYMPRAALTIGPRSIAPVLIDYPAFAGERELYAGEFDLLIDDTGGVVRVLSVASDLPPILSDAVRDAFLSARFDPGEIEGRPVRSRLRIEVTFDSRRLPS